MSKTQLHRLPKFIKERLERMSPKPSKLQAQYRRIFLKHSRDRTVNYGSKESLVYAASRYGLVYAEQKQIYQEIAMLFPNFFPQRVLDLGTGPGQTLWAVQSQWGTNTGDIVSSKQATRLHFTCIEPAKSMRDIANKMHCTDTFSNTTVSWFSGLRQLIEPKVRDQEEKKATNLKSFDLAIASHVLGEMGDERARRAAVRLTWELLNPGGFLVIVEKGDGPGFSTVSDLRNVIRNDEAMQSEIIAPCKHNHGCPLYLSEELAQLEFDGADGGEDLGAAHNAPVCHFPVRGESIGASGFRHSYFSYIVVQKAGNADNEKIEDGSVARILGFPRKRRGHVLINVCHNGGDINSLTISKKNNKEIPGIYKFSRKARWGDLFPPPKGCERYVVQKAEDDGEVGSTFVDSDGIEKTII